jgi:hypothetical protein
LPYLADIARLEWARAESYFAASAPTLTPDALTRHSTDIANVRLSRHPATRLVDSRFPIVTIWTVNQPGVTDVPRVDMEKNEAALVARSGASLVTLRLCEGGDRALVTALFEGATLGDAAAAAFAVDDEFDLQAALEQHLRHGTFADAS